MKLEELNQQYQEAIDFISAQLPMFSTTGVKAYNPGLERTLELLDYINNPHLKTKFIHIAGTNGKGSTSHILAATFQQAGYKTGLYTSPHLIDLRERIRINGQCISKEFVIEFLALIKPCIAKIQPSYFELNVAMAFYAFAQENVDIAVIETGLGGRLDSTNVITPILSIITNISFDHVAILGNTLEEIAVEKAGIIKDEVPVIIGETQAETEQIFFRKAIQHKSTIVFADSIWDLIKTNQSYEHQNFKAVNRATKALYDIKTDLLGSYQIHNIKTALTAAELLHQLGWNVSITHCIAALSHIKKTTGLHGRWEKVLSAPDVILDVAHNPAGMALAIENAKLTFEQNHYSKLHIVCGFVKDKDIDATLSCMPNDAIYYFTQAQVPRALAADELTKKAKDLGMEGSTYNQVAEAVNKAMQDASSEDFILIIGSFFIVGEALDYLRKKQLVGE